MIERIQPDELFESKRFGFTQVVASSPGRLVFVSGQVAWTRDLKVVGADDLGAQAEQALSNLGHALAAAGASPADVTMLRAYIVDYEPAQAAALSPLFDRFFDGSPPASTWVGVAALANPAFKIEIEAIAVVTGPA